MTPFQRIVEAFCSQSLQTGWVDGVGIGIPACLEEQGSFEQFYPVADHLMYTIPAYVVALYNDTTLGKRQKEPLRLQKVVGIDISILARVLALAQKEKRDVHAVLSIHVFSGEGQKYGLKYAIYLAVIKVGEEQMRILMYLLLDGLHNISTSPNIGYNLIGN